MTFLLKQIFSFLKLLNSDTGTNQIAAGVACGFILGMTPAFSLQTVLVILCMFFFRIQIGAATITAFFFMFPAYLLDPLFHFIGQKVLELESLKELFTTLYNLPIVPWTRFYNTIVMGSGVVAIVSSPFVFIFARILIFKYREKVLENIKQTKFWNAIKATSLYQWYYKYDSLYG
ncbi:MAG: TIGR03546 family protein [Pseudomonadota bacterium]|nr:TIGR03546 family protein [Pseudomonadota bacterium]